MRSIFTFVECADEVLDDEDCEEVTVYGMGGACVPW